MFFKSNSELIIVQRNYGMKIIEDNFEVLNTCYFKIIILVYSRVCKFQDNPQNQ
jgi:hypothetical protein